MKDETLAIHAGFKADSATKAVSVPIYQTVAYEFDSAQHGADLGPLDRHGDLDPALRILTNRDDNVLAINRRRAIAHPHPEGGSLSERWCGDKGGGGTSQWRGRVLGTLIPLVTGCLDKDLGFRDFLLLEQHWQAERPDEDQDHDRDDRLSTSEPL